MKSCGLCDSTTDLIGPYAGGPIPYFCKHCKAIIDRYNDKHIWYKQFMKRLREESNIQYWMRSLFDPEFDGVIWAT